MWPITFLLCAVKILLFSDKYYRAQLKTDRFYHIAIPSLPETCTNFMFPSPYVPIFPVQAELCPECPTEHLLTAKSVVPLAFVAPLCYQSPSRAAGVKAKKKKSLSYGVDTAVGFFKIEQAIGSQTLAFRKEGFHLPSLSEK